MEKMTAEEARAFLLAQPARTGKLATVRADGRPHVAPIWYDLDGDDVVFTTWHETVKAENLQRDPRAALCVDQETPPFAFVLVEGAVEIEEEADNLLFWTTRIARRYMGEERAETFGQRNAVPGEWLLRLTTERIVARKEIADEQERPEGGTDGVRPLRSADEEWVAQYIYSRWGSDRIVVHGNLVFPHTLPGFVALRGNEPVGLVTYHVQDGSCEIITLNSDRPGVGIGRQLIDAVKEQARHEGCRRLLVVTTNDNLNALRFYQKRGFALAALRPNALEMSRRLKPELPLVGNEGIPLRDEIELELPL